MRWSWPSWNCWADFPVVFHCRRSHRHTGLLQCCLPPTIWSLWPVCHLPGLHPLPTAMFLQKELVCSPLVGIQGDLFVRIWRGAQELLRTSVLVPVFSLFISLSKERMALLSLWGVSSLFRQQDRAVVVPQGIWIALFHCHLCLLLVCFYK